MTHLAMEVLPFRKVISMSCVSQTGDDLPLVDLLISLRERLLDIMSGSDRSQVLNLVTVPNVDLIDGDPAAEFRDILHEILSSGLTEHGESVDYAALRASRAASCRPCAIPLARSQRGSPHYDDFRRCTGKLRTFDPSTLPDRNAQLAFWINLYNTLVLDAVIALGVQRSIMEQRAGLTFLRRAAYVVGGQRMSCDDIEHGILRANRGHPLFPGKQFAPSDPRLRWVIKPFDARIHFALNCASRSCPPIHAYTPEKLDSQLDLATRSYLATEMQILPEKNTLHLSSIFQWFATDFGRREGIIDFVLSHLSDTPERTWLMQQRGRVSLRYKPFDWSLNSKVQTESARSSMQKSQ